MPGDALVSSLPEYISLEDAMRKHSVKPTINNVFIGESVDGPVMADFERCVHFLISSASGYGKSTVMEAIAKQLVISSDCEIVFVDYGINTFGMFEPYSKYPIASTPDEATEMFRQLIAEAERRKELMREYPQAKTIAKYNELSGDNVVPLVCFIDECASLFIEPETKKPITMLAQMSRKMGIWLVAGGTDFKASTINTSCTSNFSSRIGFHLMPGLSRSLLNCTDAFDLDKPGRGLAMLPGQKLQEIQCPIVTRWDDLPSANVEQKELVVSTLEDRIREAISTLDKVSVSAVCRELGMATGGSDFYSIRDALKMMGEI
jgi:DNA segregation ATPase FtsK/SpoIIIE-like protein